MNKFVRLIYILIFLSGLTGLIYQVTWQKYLSTLVGSHASSAAAVLALFFLFLSFGYAFFGKFSARLLNNQLLLYAALEFIIGLYALCSPQIFEFIFNQMSGRVGGESSGLSYLLLLSGAFMFLPTFFMGGTIPILTQGLSSNFAIGTKTHALIYGTNSLGAFVGCLLAGFYLIEIFGLNGTLLLTGSLNILIAISALVIIKISGFVFEGPKCTSETTTTPGRVSGTLLFISFCSGYYTFSLEKLIIRMAGLTLGSTAYTYTIIVAAFIFAISLGSIIIALNKKFERPSVFAFIQIGSLVGVMVLHQLVASWPDLVLRFNVYIHSHPLSFGAYWAFVLFLLVIILLVPVGLIGANLPLLFGLMKGEATLLSQTVGRLYMVNCFGSALGAIIGGYWVFNYLEADSAYRLMVVVAFVATIAATIQIFIGRQRTILTVFSFILVGLFFLLPNWQTQKFVPGLYLTRSLGEYSSIENALNNNETGQSVLYSRFDPNTFATVAEGNGEEKSRILYVNGQPDANTSTDKNVRAMAALIPMAIKPQKIERAFIIGLGAGLSTAVLSSFSEVKQIDVAEISEGVVKSLSYFEKFNFSLKDNMSKVNIEIGDAYRILMQKGTYELIMSEPSHLWMSGVDKLYSKEFYEIGRSHLSSTGYFVQWLPTVGLDASTMSLIFKTFHSVFPHVLIYSAQGSALTLIGSKTDFSQDPAVSEQRYAEGKNIYIKYGISSANEIYLYQLLTPFMFDAIADTAKEVHSLFSPILEYRASRAYFSYISSSIIDLLIENVSFPGSEAEPSTHYLYEKFESSITVSEIVSAYKKMAPVNIHQRIKLLSLLYKKEPNHELFKYEAAWFSAYLPLIEGREIVMKEKPKSQRRLTELQALVKNYQILGAAGMRPKLSLVSEAVENNCMTDDCYFEMRIAVALLSPQALSKQVSEYTTDIPSAQQLAFVSSEWEKIKENYKKFGAD